jgi:hypothetical protein
MREDRRKVLAMLATGRISVEEADHLLSAIAPQREQREQPAAPYSPKFLRLLLEPKADTKSQRKIDVRVPLGVIRSSLQIAKSLPLKKGGAMKIALGTHILALDLEQVNPDNVDEFMAQLGQLTADIDQKKETVRLFCE